MQWYIFCFISTFLFALSNIIDNFLSNKIFENIPALVFFGQLIGIILLPLLLFFGLPQAVTFQQMIPLIIAGILLSLYLYPYFVALRHDDTSVTVSLFLLGYVFVPVLAFIFLGERLKYYHYIGIFIVIMSSFLLTYSGKFKFHKSLVYMIVSALMVSTVDIILKYSVTNIDWITTVFYTAIVAFLSATIIALVKSDIYVEFKESFIPNIKYLLPNSVISSVGTIIVIYALSQAPVTLVKGIEASKPLMVLIIAILGQRLLKNVFKEQVTITSIVKKSIFYILLIVGVILLVI